MADDVFTAYGRGFVAFTHSRAADLIGGSFGSAGDLAASLVDGRQGSTKAAFEKLRDDIKATAAAVEALQKAIKAEIETGKAAVAEMAAELARDDFDAAALARALTALGKLLVAYDTALDKIAEEIAGQPGAGMTAAALKAQIGGMNGPIRAVLNTGAAGLTGGFDKFCKFVLGVEDASDGLGERLSWNYGEKRLSLLLGSAGPAGDGPIQFDGGSLDAYFTYKTEFIAGLELRTKVAAGLRGDKFLEKIMPGGGEGTVNEMFFSLDTKDGATFGAGKDKRMILPLRFSTPGVELREFAVEQPAQDNAEGRNRINFVATVAGKLGQTFACVIEGGGISLKWNDNAPIEVAPKIPTGAGLRIATPLVTGGGYLRYDERKKEYGGVLQLEIFKIGITAIGLIGTEPFNLVIVIGIRFRPKIELGFLFTLSGLGGILAIERTLDSGKLRDGLASGVVGQLLFPEDPVAAAPQILDQLGAVFPPRAGGLVIGPIAELGWGSQAGFVKARVGIVLSLPDPKIVVLGNVQLGVPSAEIPEQARLIDLRAEIMGEITLDYFFLKIALSKSKIFALSVSGDIALYIGWSGGGDLAFSAGGFFPGYEAPAQIGEMRRLAIGFDSGQNWLKIGISAYVAVTSNSVQFGGRVDLVASFSKVVATGWIQIDAMFAWSPVFRFTVRIDAGIKVEAFGVTLFGVTFRGELSGDKPFHIEGYAEVSILFWDIPIKIGPLSWGEQPLPSAAPEDPLEIAAAALNAEGAWAPVLPPEAGSIVRLLPQETPAAPAGAGAPPPPPRLYHPLGQIEARQIAVPLEMEIERIGSAPAQRKRINLAAPRLNGAPAGAVWPLSDRFPPGHFLNLSDAETLSRPPYEERNSGLGMGAARGARFGDATHAALSWHTVLPGRRDLVFAALPWASHQLARQALRPVARASDNPYATARKTVAPIALVPRGSVAVVMADSLAAAPDMAGLVLPASDAAAAIRLAGSTGMALSTLAKGFL